MVESSFGRDASCLPVSPSSRLPVFPSSCSRWSDSAPQRGHALLPPPSSWSLILLPASGLSRVPLGTAKGGEGGTDDGAVLALVVLVGMGARTGCAVVAAGGLRGSRMGGSGIRIGLAAGAGPRWLRL